MLLSPLFYWIVLDTLQEQFNRERFNHATYRALAANLDAVNWAGSAAWMLNASNEEQEHADKFAGYIVDRNEVPRFDVLPAPLSPVGDDLVMFFDAALKLEVMNTAEIKELHYAAEQSEDMQTCTFLIWAIEEQTKAERELTDILLLLRRLDNNGRVVFDKELK
jgi:ferritin